MASRAWVGPFTAATVETTGDAVVADAVGEPFAYVLLRKMERADKLAARARATLIAEALNAHAPQFALQAEADRNARHG